MDNVGCYGTEDIGSLTVPITQTPVKTPTLEMFGLTAVVTSPLANRTEGKVLVMGLVIAVMVVRAMLSPKKTAGMKKIQILETVWH